MFKITEVFENLVLHQGLKDLVWLDNDQDSLIFEESEFIPDWDKSYISLCDEFLKKNYCSWTNCEISWYNDFQLTFVWKCWLLKSELRDIRDIICNIIKSDFHKIEISWMTEVSNFSEKRLYFKLRLRYYF